MSERERIAAHLAHLDQELARIRDVEAAGRAGAIICRWCCEALSASRDGLCAHCHDVAAAGEVVMDSRCPFMFCLVGQPHAHPVCPDCGAVRYGNAFCNTCQRLRRGDLNPHRLLEVPQ